MNPEGTHTHRKRRTTQKAEISSYDLLSSKVPVLGGDFVQGTKLGHGHLSPKGLQGARRALCPWHTEGEGTRASSGSPGL